MQSMNSVRRNKTPEESLLIGDIGGTNARFALADADKPAFANVVTLQCNDYESADAAIKHYLKSLKAGPPCAICLAAAGPIIDKRVRFTNNHWEIAADELAAEFSIDAVRLLNDFEAIAYSVPYLTGDDCMPIGLPEPRPLDADFCMVGIIGPGTGLGAVGLRKHGDLYIPIAGEASHGGFAPETQVQMDILAALRERFDRVSSERLVSGPGLENIYWALMRIHGEKRAHLTTPHTGRDLRGGDRQYGSAGRGSRADVFRGIRTGGRRSGADTGRARRHLYRRRDCQALSGSPEEQPLSFRRIS
jgi:glucokinase